VRLLEYQAKARFAQAGIAVPSGRLARTADEAKAVFQEMGKIAIKAQVPVGGRGKAGGVVVVESADQAFAEAQRILALQIKGYQVHSVWCETALAPTHNLYLGLTLDRAKRRMAVIFSAAGGMEIEEVAHSHPERIAKVWPDPALGAQEYELRQMILSGIADSPLQDSKTQLLSPLLQVTKALCKLSTSLDATTCEINPLMVMPDGQLVAADGKIEMDDSARRRHEELATQLLAEAGDDLNTNDPLEIEAGKRGLIYVHLGGDVGVIGNGAGLVMATIDLVKKEGGDPANFLDLGGGAKADVVKKALEMLSADAKVRSVFINIFGGITRCDEVAKGIVSARDELGIALPLVVRMTGTNEKEGREILQAAGITPGVDAVEAARIAVAKARAASSGVSDR
jgi:succinyl-CoA synthetase beta subunit